MREYIFRGLLRCNHCNCGYSPELHKGKYVYMRPIKDKKNNCPHCNYIREEGILKQITDLISNFNIPSDVLTQIQCNLESLINEETKTQKQHLSSLVTKKNKIISNQQRNKDCLLDCTITKEEYEENKIQLTQELNEVENLIKDVGEVNETFKIQANTIFNLASRIYELFKSSESDEKRDIIRLIFPNLRLEAEKLVFVCRKPFDMFLNLGERPTWLPSFNIFRNKQDDILSTMNRPMMEGVRLCLAG